MKNNGENLKKNKKIFENVLTLKLLEKLDFSHNKANR